MAGIEEATVEVEGVEIFYRRLAGDGIPTVLLLTERVVDFLAADP